jgi:hypothetical protein
MWSSHSISLIKSWNDKLLVNRPHHATHNKQPLKIGQPSQSYFTDRFHLYDVHCIAEPSRPMPFPTTARYGQMTLMPMIKEKPQLSKTGTLPVTRYAESALKAQSQTHRWWPTRILSCLNSKLAEMAQILTVVSAEHVARYLFIRQRIIFSLPSLSNLTSGLRKHRVKYLV